MQVIKVKDNSILRAENNGDMITVTQQNSWELKFNTENGKLESWKVVFVVLYFTFELGISNHQNSKIY